MPIATLANVVLLMHMAGKMRFKVAIPTVITGWCISGSINIGLVAATSTYAPFPPYPTAIFSQAYYYAIYAGALYFALSGVLAVTSYGLWVGPRQPQIELSRSQGYLIVYTLLFLGYILGSAGIYSGIENWNYLDAFYFVVVTIFTIGFGDYSPHTHLGRSLLFPVATGGIVLTGFIVAKISTEVSTTVSKGSLVRRLERIRKGVTKRNALPGDPPAQSDRQNTGDQRYSGILEPGLTQSEFQLIRDMQARALREKRIVAVTLSAVAFFSVWLIGAVGFWQAEKAIDGQRWTYFEALYFTYVAQFTIGYGELTPRSNACKTAFVFWSMLALPILTVVLSAVGDAISSFGDWSTSRIRASARWMTQPSTFWKRIPTRLSTIRPTDGRDMRHTTTDVGHDNFFHGIADIDMDNLAFRPPYTEIIGPDLLAAENFHRASLALQVAESVLNDLNIHPAQKYTYKEWSWLQTLLGEIELQTRHSRNSRGLGVDEVVTTEQSMERLWLSPKSPLIAENTEAVYMLKRVLHVLLEYIEAGKVLQSKPKVQDDPGKA
jgi:potassium channel subfamily K